MTPSPLFVAAAILLASPFAAPAFAQSAGLSDADRRAGAQAHPQLVSQFGGAMSGPQADYVRRIGQKIAVQSDPSTRPQDYTVTLLNSNANNAFAIPGGYVYITRQLLALMDDEAELAFVLGHEVGHVAARHGQKRQTRAALSGILAGLAGAVTGSQMVGQGANMLAQVTTLGYSREQERQADSLGVRYLTRANYDPMASGDILAALGAQTSLEGRLSGKGDGQPAKWLSTHPSTPERVRRILAEAKIASANAGARATNRDAFLDAIDGMVVDDDPSQGTVEGRSFRHSGIGVAFDAPQGFVLQNSTEAVTGTSGNGARFQFAGGGGKGEDFAAYSARIWRQAGAQPGALSAQRINGLEVAVSRAAGGSGGRPVDAVLAVYRWGPDSYYHILGLAPQGGAPAFDPLIGSVRRMAAGNDSRARTRRVSVVKVAKGDTVQSLAARMAYDDDKIARFTVLNHVDANARLEPGRRVKLIVLR